jgi:hypothetical protein
VWGSQAGSGTGVYGSSPSGKGVWGTTTSGTGVRGSSSSGIGVYGQHTSTSGAAAALRGDSASRAADAYAVYGLLSTTAPAGGNAAVRGQNNSTNGYGIGVWGSQAGTGTGVYGSASSGSGVLGSSVSSRGVAGFSGSWQGVFGHSNSQAGVVGESGSFDGVWGQAHASCCAGVSGHNDAGGYAVWGGTTGTGTAVYGTSPSGNGLSGVSTPGDAVVGTSTYAAGVSGSGGGPYSYGVYGSSGLGTGIFGSTTSGTAGYFQGPVTITGGCTGCTGPSGLQIDDPLDPAHKYLQHASVASSQQLDIYSGNVTTNGKGFATVTMPRWFQALNRSFRYQLTSLSGLQQVAVAKQMHENQFRIQSEKPRSQVSWQVTAVRHDRYANAHPTQVVVTKPKADQGKYLHPELYGKPKADAIGYRKPPGFGRLSGRR